jgi:hypothetical protein
LEEKIMARWVVIILTSLAMVVGAVYFLEDRYVNEKETVQTLETFQQDIYRDRLEQRELDKQFTERELERNPEDSYFKYLKEKLEKDIERLQKKIR